MNDPTAMDHLLFAVFALVTVLHSSFENRDGHFRSMEPGASETLERLAEPLQTM